MTVARLSGMLFLNPSMSVTTSLPVPSLICGSLPACSSTVMLLVCM